MLMLSKRGNLIDRLVPGILAFLGYYELTAGLRIPFNFTVNRATHTYLFQAPLLGAFELDLTVYLTLTAVILYRRKLTLKPRWTIALIISNLLMALGFILNALWLSHLSIGSACLTSALSQTAGRGAKLLPGILLSLILLETLSLFSLILYYALGEWNQTFFHIVLRERLVWSPMEWISIIILMTASWIALTHILLGKPPIEFPKFKSPKRKEGKRRKPETLLILALMLTAAIVILPHLPTVNPQFKPISVDTSYYTSFLREAENIGLTEALAKAGSGRPLYLLTLYNLWKILGIDPVFLMDLLHPLMALTALTLTSFYTAYKLNGEESAGWAALLTPLGYTATGFLAGGFQANSVALTPALLTLTVNPENPKKWILLTALLTLTGLIHPWTHLMYSAILAAYNLKDKGKLLTVVAASALSYCIVYTVNTALTPSYRVETPVKPLVSRVEIHPIRSWFNAVRLWIWNTLSNPIYLSTVLLEPSLQTISAIGVIAPLTIFLSPNLICRLILNLPLQLQAAEILKKSSPVTIRALIILILLVRVLGNLTGLTPLN